MIRLDEELFVAGQLRPEDVGAAAERGVTMIVNNRPDGEQPGQPTGSQIEAAARDAGIGYRHIPISGGFSAQQVQAMADAIESAGGPVLAFCTSGTRSAYLWALARSRQGADAQELLRRAAAAGYDLSPIARFLGA